MKNKLVAMMFGAALVLGACGGDDGNESSNGDTASADPEQVYQASCVQCHGGDLEGRGGPALANIGSELSESEIRDVIEHGQGGMPGGLIKGEELDAVAKWLSEMK
jgi:cytochrome c551